MAFFHTLILETSIIITYDNSVGEQVSIILSFDRQMSLQANHFLAKHFRKNKYCRMVEKWFMDNDIFHR